MAHPLTSRKPISPPKLSSLDAAINDLPKGPLKAGLDWFNKTSPIGKAVGIGVAIYAFNHFFNRKK
ncbi:hypothetical protein GO988_21690 [Hymenobacter sp. HMF4947]|uniref:Uncharacterized protein n=1 Tax=Hymenobacter ginkgonis TaxID=2682976 RepID=A0A7K1TLG1_9BACT|nr:hypothetical protein [Hymenobacter ginkgonis]MVN78951.1 hypothetical protein [Hymenobacter ginkgonis]